VPTIAVIVAYYRFNEPDGVRLFIDRDSGGEDLADLVDTARRRFDDGYTEYIRSGGTRVGAIRLLDRQLRAVRNLSSHDFDTRAAVNVVGGIDLLERLGVLKRDIYNGVYIAVVERQDL